MTLRKSREELVKAERAYSELVAGQSIEQAEQAWLNFINALERVWWKTLHNMATSSRFQGWHGKYIALRKDDDLLAYLINARGADNHTIGEPVGIEFKNTDLANLVIKAADGSSLNYMQTPHMKEFLRLAGLQDNTVVHVGVNSKLTTESQLMRLNIVHNRGRSYSAPTKHLGKTLNSSDPISVAKLGLEFYKNFVGEVEAQLQNESI